jgi:hypothetical protein
MARALSSSIERLERSKSVKSRPTLKQLLEEAERNRPFRPYTETAPPPPPTVIEMPVAVASAPPEPAPLPEPIGGQPAEFPEPNREVTWCPRGPQDWNDDSEDMVGRCLTDYDPLEDA